MTKHTIVLKPGDTLSVSCEGESNSNLNVSNNNSLPMNGGKKSRKSSTRKNQGGGKRGPNGYMRFAAKMRKQIQDENPGADVVTVARKTGEAWRKLSDDEKAKY